MRRHLRRERAVELYLSALYRDPVIRDHAQSMQTRRGAEIQIVLAAALFSTGGAAIKACALTGWQVACFRSGAAALSIMLLVPAARRGWSWRTLIVGLAYAATMVLFVSANKLTTAANTIFLQSAAPLYILLLGPWLLREPIRRRDIPIMGLAAAGLTMFFVGIQSPQATAPDPLRGNILAALAGVSWALTIVGLRWLGRSKNPKSEIRNPQSPESTIAAVALGNIVAFAVALPWALPVGNSRPTDWVIVAFLGVFQIGLAYVFLTGGIGHITALEASLLLLIEPVLNPIWALLIHGEKPGAWALVGGLLILGATVLKSASGRPAPD